MDVGVSGGSCGRRPCQHTIGCCKCAVCIGKSFASRCHSMCNYEQHSVCPQPLCLMPTLIGEVKQGKNEPPGRPALQPLLHLGHCVGATPFVNVECTRYTFKVCNSVLHGILAFQSGGTVYRQGTSPETISPSTTAAKANTMLQDKPRQMYRAIKSYQTRVPHHQRSTHRQHQ